MIENELPEGWVAATLEKIAEIKGGKRLPQGTSFSEEETNHPYIRVSDFNDKGGIDLNDLKYVSESTFRHIKNYTISSNDIYVSIAGTIGKTGIIPDVLDGANLTENAAKIVLKSNAVTDQKFVYFFSISNHFRGQLGEATKQVAMPKLALKRLSEFKIDLPPLAEQKRIVAKLDMALGYLETLKASLARIPELLKTFRQSVLTQAVTGKLTEDWREGEIHFNGEIAAWQEVRLDNCADVIDPNPSHRNPKYADSGYLFLSTAQFDKQDGWNFEKANRVDEDTVIEQENRCKFREGSLVFSRKGTIGKTRFLPTDFRFALLDSVCVVNPNPYVVPKYLHFSIQFGGVQSQIRELTRGVALKQVSLGAVRSLIIPLPSYKEQQEIVSRVDALFAKADAIEFQYISLKEKIGKLPQALLAKAFRGELVPQDPADEPASVLLEKIQNEIGKLGKKGKRQMELVFED